MLTLILGPMKSGKSLELIAQMAPYEFTDLQVLYAQPKANIRDKGIRSRLGVNTEAIVVESLNEITQEFDILGIDEIHMFDKKNVAIIDRWIRQDKLIFLSGLDLDYRGKMPDVIVRLLELKPERLIQKISVCDVCRQYRAQFTQIIHHDKPILSGLPSIVPEDGTYAYEARCRHCFIKN